MFDHATANGLYLHFEVAKTTKSTTIASATKATRRTVSVSLDGGQLGPERKLYCRELIARFAHELAINWNIGEENTQSTDRDSGHGSLSP